MDSPCKKRLTCLNFTDQNTKTEGFSADVVVGNFTDHIVLELLQQVFSSLQESGKNQFTFKWKKSLRPCKFLLHPLKQILDLDLSTVTFVIWLFL